MSLGIVGKPSLGCLFSLWMLFGKRWRWCMVVLDQMLFLVGNEMFRVARSTYIYYVHRIDDYPN